MIVELIAATTTAKGLKVRAEQDRGQYAKGKVSSEGEMVSLRLTRNSFRGDWNYSIQPQQT